MDSSIQHLATQVAPAGRHSALHSVPQEIPVELRYNGTAYATMMASPGDLDDFARGFSLTEALVEDSASLGTVTLRQDAGGVIVDVHLPGAPYAALLRAARRILPGRTGCGLCGVRTLEEARRTLPTCRVGAAIGLAAVAEALGALAGAGIAKGLHGALFCSAQGALVLVRQDVGRHNALDKLIGALHRLADKPDLAEGFCLITSRCSYEMVQKAVRGGFSTLVAVSSPTALALHTAQEAGLTLIALARREGHVVFVDPHQTADSFDASLIP